MTTEQQQSRSIRPEKEGKQDKTERQPRSRRLAYEVLLTAVVVTDRRHQCVCRFPKIQQQEIPLDELQMGLNTPTRSATPELEVARTRTKSRQIDQRRTSLSGRIDRGFGRKWP